MMEAIKRFFAPLINRYLDWRYGEYKCVESVRWEGAEIKKYTRPRSPVATGDTVRLVCGITITGDEYVTFGEEEDNNG